MATITNSEIAVFVTPVKTADHRHDDTGIHTSLGDSIAIALYAPATTTASQRWGRCRHSLLLTSSGASRNPFFSAGCIYVASEDLLYLTSNLLQTTSSAALPAILISRVKLHRHDGGGGGGGGDVTRVEWEKLRPPPNMPMPAGGFALGDGSVVMCSQGNLAPRSGGLYVMARGRIPRQLVGGYHGRDLNSPWGAALARDGAVWFTDPCRGFDRDFRKRPQLPCHVYRFHPDEAGPRAVADGLGRPTGIAFGPGGETLYVSDTDALRGDGDHDTTRAATIYAFDVVTRSGSPFLANRRVFAHALRGVPVGLACDSRGYVYAGCADGVEVWTPGGVIEAVIEVPGGVTNLSFGASESEMFLCAEQSLWRLQFETEDEVAVKTECDGAL